MSAAGHVYVLEVLERRRGLVCLVDQRGVQVGAVGAVPGVVAVDPGQLRGEGREQVEESPGDDHVIVEAHVQRDQDHREAHAWAKPAETWRYSCLKHQQLLAGLCSGWLTN